MIESILGVASHFPVRVPPKFSIPMSLPVLEDSVKRLLVDEEDSRSGCHCVVYMIMMFGVEEVVRICRVCFGREIFWEMRRNSTDHIDL